MDIPTSNLTLAQKCVYLSTDTTYQPLQVVAPGEWHDRLVPKELSPGDPIQPTVAENAFVQVIMVFRKTFIQDSVLMVELHHCYPI
ncbi:hypothetical protein [Absidia glauca]|uniref:Ndc10 domain-containing protein n=1 Tax=Absidia glauca TaxID=4829 RepID=A0A163JFI3_ABSGL|nr:hypothetical protein [Absidia glauca]